MELYNQNFNLNCMKEYPPKKPEIFIHQINLNNSIILFKDNETLGIINKRKLPIVFYNHLMINLNYKSFYKNCKYKKVSITKRNKKKLLHIVYYYAH